MSQTKETFGYLTAEELSQMAPVHGTSLITISYDKDDVEQVIGKKITPEQYALIKERVENDDLLWQSIHDAVFEAGEEVLK
jgi:hypothetical protein